MIRADHAEITCNECAAVIKTVPLETPQATLDEMELPLDVASVCPHCAAVHFAPGHECCGQVVTLLTRKIRAALIEERHVVFLGQLSVRKSRGPRSPFAAPCT
jgi:hypothetical protein